MNNSLHQIFWLILQGLATIFEDDLRKSGSPGVGVRTRPFVASVVEYEPEERRPEDSLQDAAYRNLDKYEKLVKEAKDEVSKTGSILKLYL